MILPMEKYSFLLYHKEANNFIVKLQNLGVLHLIEKTIAPNEDIEKKKEID